VAESIRYYQSSINWPLLIDTVKEYRLTGPVGCVLHLAQLLLDVQVHAEVLQQLWPQGFDATQLERFLRRRVLDTRTWVARGLANPHSEYRPTGVAAAALRRLIPGRRYLAQRYHLPYSGIGGYLLYLARMREGVRILFGAAIRPHETAEDLAIDRWHHSLYGYRNNGRVKGD
jgi:hypothetical protein